MVFVSQIEAKTKTTWRHWIDHIETKTNTTFELREDLYFGNCF